jgi:hypothetical protein
MGFTTSVTETYYEDASQFPAGGQNLKDWELETGTYEPLWRTQEEIVEHMGRVNDIVTRNRWMFKFGGRPTFYLGQDAFPIDSDQRYGLRAIPAPGKKPSDVIECWLTEQLHIDCTVARQIFVYLAMWWKWGRQEFDKRMEGKFVVISGGGQNCPPVHGGNLYLGNVQDHGFHCDDHLVRDDRLEPGSHIYVMGCMWYHISPHVTIQNDELLAQLAMVREGSRRGENAIYVGDGKVLGFFRADAGDTSESRSIELNQPGKYQIVEYDDVLHNLQKSGARAYKNTLAFCESVGAQDSLMPDLCRYHVFDSKYKTYDEAKAKAGVEPMHLKGMEIQIWGLQHSATPYVKK